MDEAVPPGLGDDVLNVNSMVYYLANKMVVCSPELVAASIHGMAIGFFRPSGTWSLSRLRPDGRMQGWYQDIAFHRGKLYALAHNEELFAHNVVVDGDAAAGTPHVEHVIKAQPSASTDLGVPCGRMRYLVPSRDRLLMVKWSMEEGDTKFTKWFKLKVFEADLDTGRWLEVKNLEDGHALFVSRGCSKALRVMDNDPTFRGDRVYFLGVDLATCGYESTIPSYGYYDMRCGTIGFTFLRTMGIRHVRSE
ncbi:hypothetical protein ACP70R_047904 [Stipagrostis hirtigluma subsp. patula]